MTVSDTSMMDAVPAASLILFAEGNRSPARHLLIKRIAKASFAPNALVFPGGKVDDDDYLLAETFGAGLDLHEHDDAASRVAAIRETLEEAGVPVGIEPAPSPEQILAMRQGLENSVPFSDLLRDCGASLRLDALVFFARWCPNLPTSRRYDTRFFISKVDREHSVALNETEASDHCWISASEALEAANRAEHTLVFPTERNLERLASAPSYSEILAHLELVRPGLIMTTLEEVNGERFVVMPDGLGYPQTRYRVGPT